MTMTSLLVLPDELFLEVFEQSNSIDDCLRFGRCCRRLYGFLDRNRLQIMRCIILRSSVHKYDTRLCSFRDAYCTWISEHLGDRGDSSDPIPLEAHPLSSSFLNCLKADTLSDQQVWDIVARWQGLALLRDMYLCPSIHLSYCRSPSSYNSIYEIPRAQHEDPVPQEQEIDVQEEYLSRLNSNVADGQASFLAVHARDACTTERFYMALTGYWLAIEGVRYAQICRYPLQSVQNEAWDAVDTLWDDGRTMQEIFNMLEVFDFVYGYLIRQTQCSRIDTFTQWVEDEDYLFDTETMETNWQYFIHDMRVMFSPADVIELLILTSQWKREPSQQLEWSLMEKVRYLKVRGFFDPSFSGQVEVVDVHLYPDTCYSFRYLEEKFESTMQRQLGGLEGAFQNMWTDYRMTKWKTDARGTALFWGVSNDVIMDRIKRLSWEQFKCLKPTFAAE